MLDVASLVNSLGADALRVRLVALAFLLVLLACSRGGDGLPELGIDVGETSVSGLSAGAYMAGQLQVAHSKQIVGAGIVAGGPFGCAESQANSFLLSRMNVRSCHLKISSST